jgi:type I restriction enzyme S subunit
MNLEIINAMKQNNNIPQEYKDSPLEIIPVEWEVKKLREIATKIGSGVTPTGGESVYQKEGRPFLRSQNLSWGILLLDDVAFMYY